MSSVSERLDRLDLVLDRMRATGVDASNAIGGQAIAPCPVHPDRNIAIVANGNSATLEIACGCQDVAILEAWGNPDLSYAAAPTPTEPATDKAQLEQLLGGVSIDSARIYGVGSSARVVITLTGAGAHALTFECLGDMAKPAKLRTELAICAGVEPKLDQTKALRAIVLLRRIANHEQSETIEDAAVEWGASFLQHADVIDLDMDNQSDKWAGFSHLGESDPIASARMEGHSIAALATVLRHTDGTRYVRTGWFFAYAKTQSNAISPTQVSARMLSVGWSRRGKAGRIKSTRPGFKDTLAWSFYVVPADWESTR